MKKGQTAIEYLMTYGWAILIILIVAGVLAYYGIFAPAGFLSPTARGFGQVQVLNPWSFVGSGGTHEGRLTLNLENRVGGTIIISDIAVTITNGGSGTGNILPVCVGTGCSTDVVSGGKGVFTADIPVDPTTGVTLGAPGSSYTATVTITYTYQGGDFTTTGTISGTYS